MGFALGYQPVDHLLAYAAGARCGADVQVLQVAHGGELAGVFVGQIVGYADDGFGTVCSGLYRSNGEDLGVCGVDALPQVGGDGGLGLAFVEAGVAVPQELPLGAVCGA